MSEDEEQRNQESKKQKASFEAMEQVIKPKQSYWPFALALIFSHNFSLSKTFFSASQISSQRSPGSFYRRMDGDCARLEFPGNCKL